MTVIPLPDELLLLGYDDAAGKPLISATSLDLGLAGAVLVELTLAGRIGVEGKKVRVVDPAPVDDPIAEAALDKIRASNKPRSAQHWVQTLRSGLREQILDRLVETGVVEREESRVLGLFRRVRYPALNPAPETAAHGRLDAAIRTNDLSGRHTAALASLVRAIDLGPKLFPDLPARQVKNRLGEIAEGDWAGKAVKDAINAINAAMIAATTAATTAAVTTSN
ncbi:GPP34 family phosphoprotein [Cryptosporangium sp. NPDC051539]|uniref:GOLPH3/VPS74 family protein n=1 Tax=Cryptosporangium sp. NPDC051539 TaxID=3363962 RepID=UPI0037ACF425